MATHHIVREALHKHMGLRAAVIAVATSMQEARWRTSKKKLRDATPSPFQQRPSPAGHPAGDH